MNDAPSLIKLFLYQPSPPIIIFTSTEKEATSDLHLKPVASTRLASSSERTISSLIALGGCMSKSRCLLCKHLPSAGGPLRVAI